MEKFGIYGQTGMGTSRSLDAAALQDWSVAKWKHESTHFHEFDMDVALLFWFLIFYFGGCSLLYVRCNLLQQAGLVTVLAVGMSSVEGDHQTTVMGSLSPFLCPFFLQVLDSSLTAIALKQCVPVTRRQYSATVTDRKFHHPCSPPKTKENENK